MSKSRLPEAAYAVMGASLLKRLRLGWLPVGMFVTAFLVRKVRDRLPARRAFIETLRKFKIIR